MSGSYDVVVIGAGINGAGVAQAAAAAGYSVLILEKTEIAGGTSGRSSKLIHGGLRYLETAQFRLVRESLRERALLLHNAPDIVHLQAFYIPVYTTTRRRPWQLRVGLSLYAMLAGLEQSARISMGPARRPDHDRPSNGVLLPRRPDRRSGAHKGRDRFRRENRRRGRTAGNI